MTHLRDLLTGSSEQIGAMAPRLSCRQGQGRSHSPPLRLHGPTGKGQALLSRPAAQSRAIAVSGDLTSLKIAAPGFGSGPLL